MVEQFLTTHDPEDTSGDPKTAATHTNRKDGGSGATERRIQPC
jgi:hypothetical protein